MLFRRSRVARWKSGSTDVEEKHRKPALYPVSDFIISAVPKPSATGRLRVRSLKVARQPAE
jgi:hypothetical protein